MLFRSKEIEAGNLTQTELQARFRVSAEAVEYLTRKMDQEKAAAKKSAEAHEEAARKLQAHADAVKQLQAQMFGGDAIAQSRLYVEVLGGISNLTRMSKDEQAALNTTMGEAIESYKRAGQVAPQAMRDIYMATIQLPPVVSGLDSSFANIGQTVSITADRVVENFGRMKEQAKAYQAETDAMVQAYVDMQYGAQGATGAIKDTTSATGQLVVQMQHLESQARSAFEQLQAGKALVDAYSAAGVATGMQIATGGYTFAQQKKTLLPTMGATGPAPGSTQPWGNQNTLNINVNNADAGKIADKLVGEMRHSGYRF